MEQNVLHVNEDDVPVEIVLRLKDISSDNDNNHMVDPVNLPLLDTDDLKSNVQANDEDSKPLERKPISVVSLHAHVETESSAFSQGLRRCSGILYALLGSSFATLSSFIIKQLRVDFFDAFLTRFVIQTFFLTIFILYKRYKVFPSSPAIIALQLIRVILMSCGFFFFYLSYRYIPLPDLTTFRYTQVVWTAILAMIVFHERIAMPTVFAIILTLIGVVCVAQPTFLFSNREQVSVHLNRTINETLSDLDRESDQSYRFLGLCFALICAVSLSAGFVLNKKLLVLKIPVSVLIFQVSCFNVMILFINHLRNRFILQKYAHQTMFTWQFFAASAVSLLQFLSSTLTQKAIKLEHPSLVSIVQSSDILCSIVLQNLFANVKSNWLVLLGSALVTTSIILVGFHKLWNDRKKFAEQTQESKK